MADVYRVMIMPRASADLHEIFGFIEQASPRNATAVARRVLRAIDALEVFPHRYRSHEHRKDPAKSVRAMPVPPFIVYYRVDDRRRAVEVVAVIHGRRQQPRRFK